ncbi:hypothetical protein BO82DRAFT_191978 [Aspergillus uvarum CBS 121591]|uniref:Uncharacterized protein n=1 Tax=Aspergillus uvarum CBS 121591 TaxID=1448315 RepID=A0A319CEC9_9EURO|nr:hypothetical protein BO82DRAFT_191978 [Aspergillus uvarum CBS 121591]PYH76933.1 hypothetical protein BO82DRAFT_191978 [Aspergillus uvarum CBS 121591]
MCTHYYTTCCRSILDSCAKGNKTREIKRIPGGEYRNDIPTPSPGMLATCPRKTANPTLRPHMHPGSLQLKPTLAQTREERQGWQRREAVSQPVSHSRSSFEGTATASHVLRLAASTVDGRKARNEDGREKKERKKKRGKIQKERKQKNTRRK